MVEVIKMVIKKITSIVTLLCFSVCLGGCYTRCQIKSEQIGQYHKFTIVKVFTKDGAAVEFKNKKGKVTIIDDRIEGLLNDGTLRRIQISQVESLYVTKFDKDRTISWVIGTTLIVGVVVSIITSTTPPLGGGGTFDVGGFGGC